LSLNISQRFFRTTLFLLFLLFSWYPNKILHETDMLFSNTTLSEFVKYRQPWNSHSTLLNKHLIFLFFRIAILSLEASRHLSLRLSVIPLHHPLHTKMSGKLLVWLIASIRFQTTCTCVRVSRISSQMTSSTPRKAAKRGDSRNQAVLLIYCRICILLLFAWGILARRLTYLWRIYSERVTRCGICQLQWAWQNCLAENLHSRTCFEFCIQKVLCCLRKTNLYFASPISRSKSSFVETMAEGILSSLISYICQFNIRIFAFLSLLRRVDISDFPQSQ